MTTEIIQRAENDVKLTLRVALSVSFNFINKQPTTDGRAYSVGWQNAELNFEELAELINEGHAFAAQYKGNRKGENFKAAGFLAADFDGGVPLAEVADNPLVRNHATLIYTTASHGKEGEDHFRIVFALESSITDSLTWTYALMGLVRRVGSDAKCTDAARCFYGSAGSNPVIYGNIMPDSVLQELITVGKATPKNANDTGDNPGVVRDAERYAVLDIKAPIRTASGELQLIGNLAARTSIYCLFHDDQQPSAFIVRSKLGKPGIHCSSCGKTFWPIDSAQARYDFYAFDTLAQRFAEKQAVEITEQLPWESFPALPKVTKPVGTHATIHNVKYLPSFLQLKGTTYVKSPKGTGKTKQIEEVVDWAKLNNKSVLLIGHRRTLLRELSARLVLKCYMDDKDRGPRQGEDRPRKPAERPNYYAVSVNSLARRLVKPRPYDILIIDESEQVLAATCGNIVDDPATTMRILKHYVSKVPSIYLLDADLNQITTGFVRRCRADRVNEPIAMHLNTYQVSGRTCELFDSQDDLQADLLTQVRAGKKVYVACNSKRFAERLGKWLGKNVGQQLKQIVVTAESKEFPEVWELLDNIKERILQYDVVISSPAIGTGVDITFPDDAPLIDAVYGFFDSWVNTHYDIDQQLGRVRNPGCVKVWVSPMQQSFETDHEAIALELVHTGRSTAAIKDYEPDGTPKFDREDPLLCLQAETYAAQRSSLNGLRSNFKEHKKRSGWELKRIPASGEVNFVNDMNAVDSDIKHAKAERILAAKKIGKDQYEAHKAVQRRGLPMGIAASYEVMRYELEDFYKASATLQLILDDDFGRLRERIERFEDLGFHDRTAVRSIEACIDYYLSNPAWLKAFPKPLGVLPVLFVAAGIVDENGFRGHQLIEKSQLGSFAYFLKDRAHTLQMQFGVNVRKDIDKDPMKMLNAMLDLVGLDAVDAGTRKQDGKKVYLYQLCPIALKRMVGITAHRRAILGDDKINGFQALKVKYGVEVAGVDKAA